MIDTLDLDFRLLIHKPFWAPWLAPRLFPEEQRLVFSSDSVDHARACRRGGLIHTRTGNLILRERDATCGRRGVSAADEGFNKQRNSVPVVGQVADRTDQVLERRVRAVLIRVRHVF